MTISSKNQRGYFVDDKGTDYVHGPSCLSAFRYEETNKFLNPWTQLIGQVIASYALSKNKRDNYRSNKWYAERFGISERQVEDSFKELKETEPPFIKCDYYYHEGKKRRVVKWSYYAPGEESVIEDDETLPHRHVVTTQACGEVPTQACGLEQQLKSNTTMNPPSSSLRSEEVPLRGCGTFEVENESCVVENVQEAKKQVEKVGKQERGTTKKPSKPKRWFETLEEQEKDQLAQGKIRLPAQNVKTTLFLTPAEVAQIKEKIKKAELDDSLLDPAEYAKGWMSYIAQNYGAWLDGLDSDKKGEGPARALQVDRSDFKAMSGVQFGYALKQHQKLLDSKKAKTQLETSQNYQKLSQKKLEAPTGQQFFTAAEKEHQKIEEIKQRESNLLLDAIDVTPSAHLLPNTNSNQRTIDHV